MIASGPNRRANRSARAALRAARGDRPATISISPRPQSLPAHQYSQSNLTDPMVPSSRPSGQKPMPVAYRAPMVTAEVREPPSAASRYGLAPSSTGRNGNSTRA